MSRKHVVVVGLLSVLLAITGPVAGAGANASPTWPPAGAGASRSDVPGLDWQLSAVASAASAAGVAKAEGLDTVGNRVRVIVQPAAGVAAADSAVTSAGGRIEASADGLIQALVSGGDARPAAPRSPGPPAPRTRSRAPTPPLASSSR